MFSLVVLIIIKISQICGYPVLPPVLPPFEPPMLPPFEPPLAPPEAPLFPSVLIFLQHPDQLAFFG